MNPLLEGHWRLHKREELHWLALKDRDTREACSEKLLSLAAKGAEEGTARLNEGLGVVALEALV